MCVCKIYIYIHSVWAGQEDSWWLARLRILFCFCKSFMPYRRIQNKTKGGVRRNPG